MPTLHTEKHTGLPGSRFCETLVQLNNLSAQGFAAWVFYPGMLFNAQVKWWGDRGLRASPHEGIDLCLYRDENGAIHCLEKQTRIPVLFKGHIKHIIDDYLGSSLFVAHDIYDSTGNQCYTIYGHVVPVAGIAPGAAIHDGEIVAAVADTERSKIQIIPHVHISVAWIPKNFPAADLVWERMGPRHYISLVNPLDVLRCGYSIVEQT